MQAIERTSCDTRTTHQHQAHQKIDEEVAIRSKLSEAQPEQEHTGAQKISVAAAWIKTHAHQSSLEHRYHLHQNEKRIHVLNCNDGLAQLKSIELENLRHHVDRFFQREFAVSH